MDVSRFFQAVTSDRDYREQVVHVEKLPERPAQYGELQYPLPERLTAALHEIGVERLYTHQVASIDAVRTGENIVVVTATASGKTFCYQLPILETFIAQPRQRALCLYPTKALAQDQLRGLLRLKEHSGLQFRAGTYDGDTPTSTRSSLRDRAHFILTNPDMLHSGILPNHARWSDFFSNLKYIVIDEVHTYRGIFGSNVANVLRRLNRVCAHYGAEPQFIFSSATIANPKELCERLCGAEVAAVTNDGAPRGAKDFLFWNPPLLDDGSMERRSPNIEAERLMVRLVRDRVQVITFVRARVLAELIYRYCQEALQHVSPSLSKAIRAYRGGYLPEDRREIERQLFSGDLLGVVSTSALELGIDIGSLDACLIVGYAGSISSMWQRAGRAGRGLDESVVVYIAHNNPIDQYLVHHPEYFFGQSHEHAIIDPENPHILVGHLRCAAAELPIPETDMEPLFGAYAPAVAELLAEEGQLHKVAGRWHWASRGYPASDVDLRNLGDNTYTIVDTTEENRVIGTVDEFGAFTQLHTEAVYMHDAETYFVKQLDLKQRVAYVEKADVDYYTQAVTETNIRIDETEEERPWRVSQECFGQVTVTMTTIMFRKIKFHGLDSVGFGNLDLPPQELETMALWVVPPLTALRRVRDFKRIPTEGMLGIANVATQVVPLHVLCDSMDIGSVVDSSNLGIPTLFIYDKYPGGLGFAQRAYQALEEIMSAALEVIANCPCSDGCPSCVGSSNRTYSVHDANVETRERIPDKEAALILLHDMLEREPYIPKPLPEDRLDEAAARHFDTEQQPVRKLSDSVELKVRKQIQRFKHKRG